MSNLSGLSGEDLEIEIATVEINDKGENEGDRLQTLDLSIQRSNSCGAKTQGLSTLPNHFRGLANEESSTLMAVFPLFLLDLAFGSMVILPTIFLVLLRALGGLRATSLSTEDPLLSSSELESSEELEASPLLEN